MNPTPTQNQDAVTDAPREPRIVSTADTCGGKPRIDGTRIKVAHVAIWYERMGLTPDEIVSRWPHLTLTDVHTALAYYYAHRQQIDDEIKEGEAFANRLRGDAPSIFEKARQRSAPDDSLSPG